MSSIDKYLAVHANAITFRTARAELLASNLANADTPGYKAQGLDFAAAMKQATESSVAPVTTSHPQHIPVGRSRVTMHTYLRDVQEKSIDENTVNSELERIKFADNDVRYQASVQFITGKINSLVRTIRGE